MSVMVEQQDETINVIETTAAAVEKDVEVGYVDFGLRCGAGIDFELQSQLHGEGCGFGAGSTKEALDLLHPCPRHPCNHWYRCGRCRRTERETLDHPPTHSRGRLTRSYEIAERWATTGAGVQHAHHLYIPSYPTSRMDYSHVLYCYGYSGCFARSW